jgi:hypothetical protein
MLSIPVNASYSKSFSFVTDTTAKKAGVFALEK